MLGVLVCSQWFSMGFQSEWREGGPEACWELQRHVLKQGFLCIDLAMDFSLILFFSFFLIFTFSDRISLYSLGYRFFPNYSYFYFCLFFNFCFLETGFLF